MAKRQAVKVNGAPVLDLGELNAKQRLFVESRTLYTAYGGAKGGGKTHAVRIKAVGGATQWPGIRILILRRAYPELEQNHIMPIVRMVPPYLASYNGTTRVMSFSNGSIIKFGHYHSATAEQEYQGQEYDWIFMDEATQFTESEFRYLGGCLRGANAVPKRFYLTCNPGGIGHNWVKRLFIDRDFRSYPDEPERTENPDDYKFIFATVEDNTHLLQSSPGYLSALSSMPENVYKAFRFGDWDALAGGYFPEFSKTRHVIAPFQIPPDWNRYRALDYGLDMLACYWVAVDHVGHCYVYREFTKPNLTASEAAREILEHTMPSERIETTFIPPDMWNRQKDSGKTIAEVFMIEGLGVRKADNNLFQGGMQIKEMLMNAPDGKPYLQITTDCPEIIKHLPIIQSDENDPNKYSKEPHDITHTVDALRYFCVSRTLVTETHVPVDPPEDDDMDDYDDFMTGGQVSSAYITFGGTAS